MISKGGQSHVSKREFVYVEASKVDHPRSEITPLKGTRKVNIFLFLQVETVESPDVSLRYMTQKGNVYDRPCEMDCSLEPVESIICVLEPPSLVNNRGQQRFNAESLEAAKQMCLNKAYIKRVVFK